MKRLNILITFVLIACLLQGCFIDWNAPLRNHMISYYSDDSNYVNLVGRIVDMQDDVTNKHQRRQIEIIILSGNCTEKEFKFNTPTGYYFSFCGPAQGVKEGDIISFTTAPMLFYNGDTYRIVSLEKDGEIFYTFEEGKQNLLDWIEETFGKKKS